MFGTFTLFNFFQQPNSGKIPPEGTYNIDNIINGVAESGAVADFNWGFPYAQTAIPIQIIEGGGGLFQLSLFSDTNSTGNGVEGLRYATIAQTFSGNLGAGNVDIPILGIGMSGTFYPIDSGQGACNFNFSGNILGAQSDNSLNSLIISGYILGFQSDNAAQFINISGNFTSCLPDVDTITLTQSGSFYAGNQEGPSITIALKGSFNPTNEDSSNISYSMLSFSSLFNKIVSGINLEDECNITYGFNSFTSAR